MSGSSITFFQYCVVIMLDAHVGASGGPHSFILCVFKKLLSFRSLLNTVLLQYVGLNPAFQLF